MNYHFFYATTYDLGPSYFIYFYFSILLGIPKFLGYSIVFTYLFGITACF